MPRINIYKNNCFAHKQCLICANFSPDSDETIFEKAILCIEDMSLFRKHIYMYIYIYVTPPGSTPSQLVLRAGLEPGILAREAGGLPRRLKATVSSVSP